MDAVMELGRVSEETKGAYSGYEGSDATLGPDQYL